MDPISPLLEHGLGIGGVIVCTVLFIWNTLQITGVKRTQNDILIAQAEDRKLIVQLVDTQQKFMARESEQHATMAANLLNLGTSISEVVRELISVIRDAEKN